MRPSRSELAPDTRATATLVFDGDCGFCSTSARFLRRWAPASTVLVPWQYADLAELGLSRQECTAAVRWVSGSGRDRASGAAAVGRYLETASGRVWRWVGAALRCRPVLGLAEPLYDLVARNRYRLPGGTPACAITLRSQQSPDQ